MSVQMANVKWLSANDIAQNCRIQHVPITVIESLKVTVHLQIREFLAEVL